MLEVSWFEQKPVKEKKILSKSPRVMGYKNLIFLYKPCFIPSHYLEKPDPKSPVALLKDVEKNIRAMENPEFELSPDK